MLPAQPNQSLIDGLACLQALAMTTQPVGVRELARQLELEPTRVSRLLGTLAHLGLAHRNAERKYEPGPAMHVLSAQSMFGSGLIRKALEPLQRLKHWPVCVALGVLWGNRVCYLYFAKPGRPFSEALGRIGLFPAQHSSFGLCLLAQQDKRTVRQSFPQKTIELEGKPVRFQEFWQRLQQIKTAGQAVVKLKHEPSEYSVGIPLGRPAHAGLACSGRMQADEIPTYIEGLRATAQAIVET